MLSFYNNCHGVKSQLIWNHIDTSFIVLVVVILVIIFITFFDYLGNVLAANIINFHLECVLLHTSEVLSPPSSTVINNVKQHEFLQMFSIWGSSHVLQEVRCEFTIVRIGYWQFIFSFFLVFFTLFCHSSKNLVCFYEFFIGNYINPKLGFDVSVYCSTS